MNYINNNGYKVEKFVKNYFENNLNVDCALKNLYYDLLINFGDSKFKKIEIKSTNLLVQNGKGKVDFGRFYFDISNLKHQLKSRVDVCFVVCVGNSYEIIGFMNILSINSKFKAKKYIMLKDIMSSNLTRKEKYLNKLIQRHNLK